MERELDDSLVEINKRYQDLFYSSAVQKELKRKKYLEYISKKNYRQILEDIFFKIFIRIPSSQNGNVNMCHPGKENSTSGNICTAQCRLFNVY